MLKLMYITNNPDLAIIAENAGIDRIFIDMEYIGKNLRQNGLDTVQNHHTIEDIKRVRKVINKAELLVRCNPIHSETSLYCSSEQEINDIVKAGANIIMLPYFKTVYEVEKFLEYVGNRAKTILLFETSESIELLDDILRLKGICEVYIGLNDLSLSFGKSFMFELLADGTVDYICDKIKLYGYPFGFGGIASIGKGEIPAEKIIMEHYRIGSSSVILSRSFCNSNVNKNLDYLKDTFYSGVEEIRKYELICKDTSNYSNNREELKIIVDKIIKNRGEL